MNNLGGLEDLIFFGAPDPTPRDPQAIHIGEPFRRFFLQLLFVSQKVKVDIQHLNEPPKIRHFQLHFSGLLCLAILHPCAARNCCLEAWLPLNPVHDTTVYQSNPAFWATRPLDRRGNAMSPLGAIERVCGFPYTFLFIYNARVWGICDIVSLNE